jgi:nucleotide-binding universal stress UspA family protein
MGRRVADRARLAAETLGSDLTLVHVQEPVPEHLISRAQQRLVQEYRTGRAAAVAEWIRSRTPVAVELRTPRGSTASVVCSIADRGDLIVTGSSSVDPGRLGPLPRRLARKARSDVLVVRRQPRVPYRRVVAAVDLSDVSASAVELALRLAPEGTVTVTYAIPSDVDALLADSGLFPEELEAIRRDRARLVGARLDEFVAVWDGRVGTLIVDGPPSETVEETARRRNADLVAVSSRGADRTSLVLLGGNAESIMEAVPCDVAVARVDGPFRRRSGQGQV